MPPLHQLPKYREDSSMSKRYEGLSHRIIFDLQRVAPSQQSLNETNIILNKDELDSNPSLNETHTTNECHCDEVAFRPRRPPAGAGRDFRFADPARERSRVFKSSATRPIAARVKGPRMA